MFHHLKLYLHHLKLHLESRMEYKTSFYAGVIANFLVELSFVVLIWVIFTQVPEINGWIFPELLLLSGIGSISISLWHGFGTGLWEIDEYVRRGQLDRLLTRPINPLFLIIASDFDEDGIGDFIAGLIKVGIASSMLSLVWSPQNIFLFILFILSGAIIVSSLTLIAACVAFWTTRSKALINIILNFSTFTDYPIEIYNTALVFLLSFVLPFAFVNYYPAEVFLGKGIYMQIAYLGPVVAIILALIAYSFWKFSLAKYASTGS